MKEILKKYKRQVQIAGGICLIAVLGIGGYVAANQDTAVQTQTEMKKETKSSDQKITKNDTKDAALEKKTDTKKETVKKEDTKSEKVVEQKETTAKKSESADNKSTEKTNKKAHNASFDTPLYAQQLSFCFFCSCNCVLFYCP